MDLLGLFVYEVFFAEVGIIDNHELRDGIIGR